MRHLVVGMILGMVLGTMIWNVLVSHNNVVAKVRRIWGGRFQTFRKDKKNE